MKALGIPHLPEPKRFPALFRKAAALADICGPIDSVILATTEDTTDAVKLAQSFFEGNSYMTDNEAVLGLLLLAEILESAE